MRYYQVSVSSEPKIIGVKNGIYQIEIDEKRILQNTDYDEFKSFFNYNNKDFWNSQDEIKFLNAPVIRSKLLKRAKLTDIMGYAPEYCFLSNIYSDKFLKIIKEHNLGNYYSFDVDIDGIMDKYFLLFFKTIKSDEINFEKSLIVTGHKILNNLKYYNIKNYFEFRTFLFDNPLATFEKIAISKEHYGKDIISIQATGGHFYSEKLIDFLLDCGITGLQISYKNSIVLEFV